MRHFGKRYLDSQQFLKYLRELDLFPSHRADERFLEFLERIGVLFPVARVRFPTRVVRRWHKDRYPKAVTPGAVERDTPLLTAASELYHQLWFSLPAKHLADKLHVLDDLPARCQGFVQRGLDTAAFVRWKDFRVAIQREGDGKVVYDGGQYSKTYYHYWQMYFVATFMRSCATVLYDVHDRGVFEEILEFSVNDRTRDRTYRIVNFEATGELTSLRHHETLFDAVSFFEFYRHRALQAYSDDIDRATGELPTRCRRAYRKREKELAQQALKRWSLRPAAILKFRVHRRVP